MVAALDAAALARLAARRRWRDAAELALLTALFVLVPPLPAFGIYFGGWHGLRHLARLAATDPANHSDLARGLLTRPLGRLARHAALPTLAVLTALVVLVAAPDLAHHAASGLVASGLALLFALTVPHLAVVTVLDHHQLGRPGSRSSGHPRSRPCTARFHRLVASARPRAGR